MSEMIDQSQAIQRWVRPAVQQMKAYHVGDAQGLIKLDAMENPFGFPQWMIEQWLGQLRHVALNRYPDPSAAQLKQRLRDEFGIADKFGLVLGNGSDELIQMLALAVGGEGRVILAPEPGFVMYRLIAGIVGMDYVGVPLADDFSLPLEAMLDAIERHQPALIFLAYPNNPTGNLFDGESVRRILAAAPGLVVIDEAYFSFAAETFLTELADWPQLIVMRTLSKLGLAGLRLGWMAGHPQWLEEVEKTRLPYNIGSLTQASTEFALANSAIFAEQTAQIVAERERMAGQLRELPGIEVFPSAANFLLLRVPPGRADELFDGLRERGVLIKKLHGSTPALFDCLRVTAGSTAENDAFVGALGALL